jgi:hypothetical protein
MMSFSFTISAAVADDAAPPCGAVVLGGAVAVAGAGTGAGGLSGGSRGDGEGIINASDRTHHSTSAKAAAAITLIKLRSMAGPPSSNPSVIEVMREHGLSMGNQLPRMFVAKALMEFSPP